MVTSQVSGRLLGHALPSEGPWHLKGENSRVNQSSVKIDLFREMHTPWTAFMGWVTSCANQAEAYSSSFGGGVWVPRNQATARILALSASEPSWHPWEGHLAAKCITMSI